MVTDLHLICLPIVKLLLSLDMGRMTRTDTMGSKGITDSRVMLKEHLQPVRLASSKVLRSNSITMLPNSANKMNLLDFMLHNLQLRIISLVVQQRINIFKATHNQVLIHE